MRITSFEYKDHAIEWTLENIDFNSLTLLVGASGVGKTRILKAILHLKKIALGASLNGLEWKVKFVANNQNCEWSGCFENKGFLSEIIFYDPDKTDDKDKSNIEFERLYVDDKLVIERNLEGINFNGVKTVKLSQKESAISLLKEEDNVNFIYKEFSKIVFDDGSQEKNNILNFIVFDNDEPLSKCSKYTDLDSIRNSDESLKTKLYLAYKNVPKKFREIQDSFIDVFPYVEGLRIDPIEKSDERMPRFFKEMPLIQIKETGVNNWIDERKLSSGMYRTLMLISELHLCADGTIILIDEFENSLGINCIDDVTRNIATYSGELQFIITSHHPYIINNISIDNWKVITRKAGVVKNYNASELNLGKSKHEAFTQLINLDKYLRGIDL